MRNLLVCVSLCVTQLNGQVVGTLHDGRDGKDYRTVRIGNQWWMAENLNHKTRNGSLYYDNDGKTNSSTYGMLYDWNTAATSCPNGWHLPSHEEWSYLEMELGFRPNEPVSGNNMYGRDEGGMLKEAGYSHWLAPNIGASNTTGFSALPGGHFSMNQFWGRNKVGHFWAGEKDSTSAWYRSVANNDARIHIFYQEKSNGYKSLRCVRDSIILTGRFMGQSSPGRLPKPFGLGIISRLGSNEHTVSFSPDGKEMYFTRDPDRKTFTVRSQDGEWTTPVPARFNGREAIFSPRGSRLLFGDGDIWFVKKKNDEWSSPQKFNSNINTEAYEFYASMSDNGTLYFSRLENRHPSIFASQFRNGEYLEAMKLPAPINLDSGNNFHPFISPDEDYLIFNSDRTGGFGDADLYISYKNKDGHWERPINLGGKINSELRDICPTITPDGRFLFFTRNWEEDGKWQGDVYWVSTDFINEFKRQSPDIAKKTRRE